MSNSPKANPNVPQIPQPLADVGALAVAVQFVKQGVDSLAGNRGHPNDRAVTFNDLLNLGVVINTGTTGATTSGVIGAPVVTTVVAGAGLSGGTVTTTGTISLAAIGGGMIMGNPNVGTAVATGVAIGTGLSLSAGGTLSAPGVGLAHPQVMTRVYVGQRR